MKHRLGTVFLTFYNENDKKLFDDIHRKVYPTKNKSFVLRKALYLEHWFDFCIKPLFPGLERKEIKDILKDIAESESNR